jgi:hypothetical protein
VAVDPKSEIITATEVTPGNVADGDGAESLLADVLAEKPRATASEDETAKEAERQTGGEDTANRTIEASSAQPREPAYEIFGDASYGTANLVETIEGAGAKAHVKVQAPVAPDGRFSKEAFVIDLGARTVSCPGGFVVSIREGRDGGGLAGFGVKCATCPLRSQCTADKEGRTIRIHPQAATLQRKRAEQKSPEWKSTYRKTRPRLNANWRTSCFERTAADVPGCAAACASGTTSPCSGPPRT